MSKKSNRGFTYLEVLICGLLLTIIVVPVVLAFYSIYNIQAVSQRNYIKVMLANSLLAMLANHAENNPEIMNSDMQIYQLIGKTEEGFAELFQTHIFAYTVEFYFNSDTGAITQENKTIYYYIYGNHTIDLTHVTGGYVNLILQSQVEMPVVVIYTLPNMQENIALILQGEPLTAVLLPQHHQSAFIYILVTVEDEQGRSLQVGVSP